MKRINKKLAILLALTIAILLLGLGFYLIRNSKTTLTEKLTVIERGYSVCTQDVPSSSCGPYEVKVQTPDGKSAVYKVPGYEENEKDREIYQRLSTQIDQAKEQNSQIVFRINDKNEIVSIQ